MSLHRISEYHKLAELGVVIGDKNFWGKGVASEVVAAVVQHAFTNFGIVRISAEAEAGNIGVQKVLERAGFEHDGLFRSARVKNGKRIDVHHYGIIVPG